MTSKINLNIRFFSRVWPRPGRSNLSVLSPGLISMAFLAGVSVAGGVDLLIARHLDLPAPFTVVLFVVVASVIRLGLCPIWLRGIDAWVAKWLLFTELVVFDRRAVVVRERIVPGMAEARRMQRNGVQA